MLLKRLLVGVLISAQRTKKECVFKYNNIDGKQKNFKEEKLSTYLPGLLYLHMNHIDVPFEYNQMLERFSANGALMRTFTHVVNWKEIKIDRTMV